RYLSVSSTTSSTSDALCPGRTTKRFGSARTCSYSWIVIETRSSQVWSRHSQMNCVKAAFTEMSSMRSLTSRKRLSFIAARSRRVSPTGGQPYSSLGAGSIDDRAARARGARRGRADGALDAERGCAQVVQRDRRAEPCVELRQTRDRRARVAPVRGAVRLHRGQRCADVRLRDGRSRLVG